MDGWDWGSECTLAMGIGAKKGNIARIAKLPYMSELKKMSYKGR